jgi:hypothetical protein
MIYEIRVQGHIDANWSDWFNGMQILAESGAGRPDATTLCGDVRDQVCLRGILNHLWDLNLSLVSVNRIDQVYQDDEKSPSSGEGIEP